MNDTRYFGTCNFVLGLPLHQKHVQCLIYKDTCVEDSKSTITDSKDLGFALVGWFGFFLILFSVTYTGDHLSAHYTTEKSMKAVKWHFKLPKSLFVPPPTRGKIRKLQRISNCGSRGDSIFLIQ